MAKDDEDLIEQATPKEEDGMKVPTRSTADPDIDTEARGRAMSLDNMQIDPADVEDVTPAKLRDHYQNEVRHFRAPASITGLETRIRRDYDKAGKTISDEKLRELANEILGL